MNSNKEHDVEAQKLDYWGGRALPVVDPEDRALTISCGVALYHLILAIRYFGFEHRLEVLPTTLLTNLYNSVIESSELQCDKKEL